jgi:hypothetical protein
VTATRDRRAGVAMLVGAATGFVACVVAGHVVSDRLVYPGFVRWTKFTSATTSFFPTASQLRAIVRAQCAPDRTLVVVAGNSVFNGPGQSPDRLWSRRLQEELGEEYCVVNFATALSMMGDIPGVSINMLWREYPRLVLVVSTLQTTCGAPDGSPVYSYVFWDAYWKRLLTFPEEPRRHAEDAARAEGVDPVHREELRIRSMLDAVLRFEDLWTFVGYRGLFTLWTVDTGLGSIVPRSRYPDTGDDAPPRLPRDPAGVARFSEPFYEDDGQGGWRERPETWQRLEREIAVALPGPFRARTLVVTTEWNPSDLELLTPRARARQALLSAASAARWERAGYQALLTATDFSADDYLDLLHLSTSGGDKIARRVAPFVRRIAAEATASGG